LGAVNPVVKNQMSDLTPGDNIKTAAARLIESGTVGHLVSGVVMAAGFLIGFLPLYTGFLDRLGGYDKHFAVNDDRLQRIEKDVDGIEAGNKASEALTATRLDTVLQRLQETRELMLTKQGTK
jgi:hypothetical protein